MFDLGKAGDVELVDRLTELERRTSSAAAEQARLTAELHARRARDLRSDRSVAQEVALARRESPYAGREHLALALALVHDLPETLAALERGEINERRAMIIARETAHLVRTDRAEVDARLGSLAERGDREIQVAVRRLVHQVDADAAEERARRARAGRRVTVRGLGDGMARISADVSAADAIMAIQSLLGDPEAEVFVRRVFASPTDDGLVAMESRATTFPSSLRRLLFLHDGETCRTPWCDARVRHADHVTPRRRGGHTDLDQGQGLCEACNYAKEQPAWIHRVTTRWPERHSTVVTTPTGHRYRSRAPALPVRPRPSPRTPDPRTSRPRRPVVEIYDRPELQLSVA